MNVTNGSTSEPTPLSKLTVNSIRETVAVIKKITEMITIVSPGNIASTNDEYV